VAHSLGADAILDLKALKIRMERATNQRKTLAVAQSEGGTGSRGYVSSSVTLSTSSSELKLLRVLQTLQALCGENWDDSGSKRNEGSVIVTAELVQLLSQLEFSDLWDELSSCLAVVQVLEGVKAMEDEDKKEMEETEDEDQDNARQGKKLRNSAAGLLSRFLPSIEAFFVANASATRPQNVQETESIPGKVEEIPLENLVGGQRLIQFVATNKVLLNALVRSNSSLLDKGLRALVQVSRCRPFLDFDVKRQWFKTQMRRLRQQASRRHGSLRLHIRRKYVFEDAYHQLRLRNAEEMRGRLHITFREEEGVDAGGLSREFFGILAKEMFNPNYALFTSTEDGCTFQPNPNSGINPDHLSYFRFVGRIVGKAVADGYLLDAHFTRSLYKHMLGMKPTHDDMEAIDPDYYRNLKTILEYNLADIGLELTFSIEDHSFGRSQTIDLIPNGRNVHVTEESKEEYVRLICQNRMTTAIQSQIKSYLDGFYELVNPELIAIFTPRELELLISGLPDIDVLDLKKNTEYTGWKATDKEIEWFWNIMFSLSRKEKASFLQFVTGSSKVPLSGFSELQGMRGIQRFSIHKTPQKGALMSAHTCFNSLDLPSYGSEDEMREKLLYAINEGGGAFLFA
jgi:E3 ubiquitin-protein ligase HUWE1